MDLKVLFFVFALFLFDFFLVYLQEKFSFQNSPLRIFFFVLFISFNSFIQRFLSTNFDYFHSTFISFTFFCLILKMFFFFAWFFPYSQSYITLVTSFI